MLLRLSAQLHDPSEHAAMDAMFFDRENASKHYCRRTNYRVQTLKTTALIETESQAILDVTVRRRNATPRNSAGEVARVEAVLPVAPYNPRNTDSPLDIEYRIEDRIENHTEDVHLKQSVLEKTYNRRTQVERTTGASKD